MNKNNISSNIKFTRMCMKIVIILLSVAMVHLEAQYATECRTPDNQAGKCMPLRSCKDMLARVHQMHATPSTTSSNDTIAYLRQAFCGHYDDVHHICCANEQIQLNEIGVQILQNVTCGKFSIPKVAFGYEAELFAFPWMVLLKYSQGKPFRCGGTLISERYVLTAAHCVHGFENILTEVRLGEHNITSEQDCTLAGIQLICADPIEEIFIEKIIVHPAYRANQLHHDIALLRLVRAVVFQKHIRPICLPITQRLINKIHSEYIVSGWGHTEDGESSDVLMWASVPHQTLEACRKALHLNNLTMGHICAGGENMIDSCKGDSGGPLTQMDIYGGKLRMVQFGIVSFGVATCGQRSLPGVYTNISHYLQWISDNMNL